MDTSLSSTPHSVKRWQLSGTDYEPQRLRSLRDQTRFSSWTPLHDKTSNLQVRAADTAGAFKPTGETAQILDLL